MKIYALFLPQFHEINENNEWWGKGFTEWHNVKRAMPLYKGHVQPRKPLNNRYYDLLEKDTVIWQTNLMHQYGIDAMIYYHYYFNGRLLLEKPAENLLRWKEIDQPFFFNWANHSWNRSWKGSREILLEQTYGNAEDWKKHFDYLLPFFQDDRYVKKDNKPLFIIYNSHFGEKNQMFECFDRWCKEAGFDGIYLIEECYSIADNQLEEAIAQKSSVTQKIYLTEPLAGRVLYNHYKSKLKVCFDRVISKLNQIGLIHHVQRYDANKLLRLIMKEPSGKDDMVVPGVFFEWDNTPRHGSRGYVISPLNEQVFYEYMDCYKNSEFMIVNAWNEWCEGMVLEPTEECGHKYLEWIRNWKQGY